MIDSLQEEGMVWFLPVAIVSTLLGVVPARASCSSGASERFRVRFEVRDDLIYDRKLRLSWDRCSFGKTFKNGKCTGSIKFVSLDEARRFATSKGKDWRVPTVEELSNLLDKDCTKPAVSTNIFDDVGVVLDGGSPYWTSSRSWLPNTFYFVDFVDGFVDAHSPGFPIAVRFVKG